MDPSFWQTLLKGHQHESNMWKDPSFGQLLGKEQKKRVVLQANAAKETFWSAASQERTLFGISHRHSYSWGFLILSRSRTHHTKRDLEGPGLHTRCVQPFPKKVQLHSWPKSQETRGKQVAIELSQFTGRRKSPLEGPMFTKIRLGPNLRYTNRMAQQHEARFWALVGARPRKPCLRAAPSRPGAYLGKYPAAFSCWGTIW